jgi:hypothetical protein
MRWFDSNPYGINPSARQEFAWDVHQFGRQLFASNYARGGFAATAFAPTPGEAFKSVFRRTHKYGSPAHLSNLKIMQKNFADPQAGDIGQIISKVNARNAADATKVQKAGGFVKGAIGKALPVGFLALPAFTTPGTAKEKGRAVVGGAAGYLGWEAGSKLGMAAGAAIGSAVPGVGNVLGAAVGYLVGGFAGAIGADEGTQALTRVPDRLIQRERDRRKLDWVGDQTAFMTQSAATMRQQSLLAMNRGLMNARSALGRESIMMHQ